MYDILFYRIFERQGNSLLEFHRTYSSRGSSVRIWEMLSENLAWISAILAVVFCGFSQSLQANAGMVPR
jgi:hypothetical protein